MFLLKYKFSNCFFPSVKENIVESFYKNGIQQNLWNLDDILLLKYKLSNCFFSSVKGNILESFYKNGIHWLKQKDRKAIIMFIKIMLIKNYIKNIFNILNKIIMHIFLLSINI